MTIHIDVTNSCRSAQNTGIQRMTRKIFAELSRVSEVRPVCWNKVGNFYTELGPAEDRFLTRPFEGRAGASSRPEWRGQDPFTEFWRFLSRRRVDLEQVVGPGDVFFVPEVFRDRRCQTLPDFFRRSRARKVAIFHDAADFRLTSIHGDRSRQSRPYLEALALFDLVICVSKETRDDLHYFWEKYGCPATATCVESWPGPFEGARPVREKQNTSDVVLYVSSLQARKNHLTLLRAAEQLWARGCKFELHLIGRSAEAPLNKIVRQIWRLQMRGRPLRWLRHVDEQNLDKAYRDCRFTVYPSLMEGFGLPILESLWHGKPCLCGGNGALGETAAGGGCLTVDQTNENALASGMEQLLKDEPTYARLSEEARARKFESWSEYIDRLRIHLRQPETVAPKASFSAG